MTQIQALIQELVRIGFEIESNENFIKITDIKDSLIEKYQDKIIANDDFVRLLDALQIVIELENPELQTPKILFQDCSLKVYFEGWDFFEIAKLVKFDIAVILNDNGIFNGMGFEIPKDHNDVIVP